VRGDVHLRAELLDDPVGRHTSRRDLLITELPGDDLRLGPGAKSSNQQLDSFISWIRLASARFRRPLHAIARGQRVKTPAQVVRSDQTERFEDVVAHHPEIGERNRGISRGSLVEAREPNADRDWSLHRVG